MASKKSKKKQVEFRCDRCRRKVRENLADRNKYDATIRQAHEEERTKMRLCRTCMTVNKHEIRMKYQPPEQDLMVRDHVGAASTKLAEAFILHQLGQYDLSDATLFVTLRRINNYEGSVIVKPLIPVRPRAKKIKGQRQRRIAWRPWYEVGVQVRNSLTYPHTETRNVGSIEVTDPVSRAIMKETWFYETAEITFHDEAEAFVFGAGNGLFKVLRKHIPKIVPGRATKVGMNAHGVTWLEEFRKWRKTPPGEAVAHAI